VKGSKTYRDLEIYKISHSLAVKVHHLSLKLPQYEMHEEGSQVRRSSKSISACIVEGYGRRQYKAEFIKFLIYAHASCDETIEHLSLIKETHSSHNELMEALMGDYERLGGKINRFVDYVEQHWNQDAASER
jgi:four helix bundle protein